LRRAGPGGRTQYATNLVPENATQLGIGFTEDNFGHVEAQAAALLRRLALQGVDVSHAWLVVNRPFVCVQAPGNTGCAPNLPRMLPPGSILDFYGAGPRHWLGNLWDNFLRLFRRFFGLH
jgi:SCP1.201-like deaminase